MSITIKVLGDSSAIGMATAWNSLITILIGLVFGYVCRAFKRFTLASSVLIQAIAFAILVAAPSLGVITVGGIDWFGVVWSYKEGELAPVPDSSVPPICLNICGWRETVIFPDMEAWDWGGGRSLQTGALRSSRNLGIVLLSKGRKQLKPT